MSELKPTSKLLSRRDFIILSEAMSMGLILSSCGVETTQTEPPAASDTPLPTSTKPQTSSATPLPTSTEIPAATPTPDCFEQISQNVVVQGQHYMALVPDTLDLHENAKLAINALTRCTNPDDSCETYFYGSAARNPPVMFKADGLNSKFCEGLSLMRYLTGSSFNTQVDQRWRDP